jgi:hypothetical protein
MWNKESMEPKKWMLSDTRLEKFQAKEVYTVCCHVSDCPCESKSAICPRGFFSLFIQAIYGIDLANRYGLSYYIDFGNHTYLYTDPARQDRNVWNYYFEQTDSNKPAPAHIVRNSFNEVYPLRIWRRKHFFRLNNVVRQLVFKKEIEQKLLEKEEYFNAHKILGVQIRRTDHSQEVEPVPTETFCREIDKRLHKYDYLFVSTDDNKTLDLLKKQYGSKLVFNEVNRSDTQHAVHSNLSFSNRYKLGEEAILDCYCLSLCKHAILIQSNISYAALLFNPKLSYTLLEVTGVRDRLKRRVHSYLDGIHALFPY